MRALGIKRLAIELTDDAHTDPSKPASVELAADAPASPYQRAVDIHEQQLLDDRDARRRLAERQAEEDSILFAASISY
jgi:hypothetical protein